MTMTALDHAQALIRCPSVTPTEGGALRYLEHVLSDAGFTCHWLTFSEAGTADVDNLYARIGTGGPHVCFAGHTDVVPPGDTAAWSVDPFGAAVADGKLFGRGACDMKGGVAASVAAALHHLEALGGQPRGSISFLITGDEEGASINGTEKVVRWLIERGERPDFCILPECTSEERLGDVIKIGRRGSLSSTLTMHGLQGHAAYPHKSRNPLTPLIAALHALKAEPLDQGTEHFEASNLEITSIDTGNPAHNVIPAKATARFNIRFNTRHTRDSLDRLLREKIDAATAGTGVTFTLTHEKVSPCFLTEPGPAVEVLRRAVRDKAGVEPTLATNGGTSDARFIKDLCPVVELGLPNATAHKVDEHIRVADLDTLTEVFRQALHELGA
jgi:succinyl-diaminopimelate desuccinylase